VIIPGYGDTPLSWLPVATILSRLEAFRASRFDELVLLEFPGYIGSLGAERAIGSTAGLIAAVTAAVDGLAPYALVGQSMGGFLAAHYASELKARGRELGLERLVLFCPMGMNLHRADQESFAKTVEKLSRGNVDGFMRGAIGPAPGNPFARLPYEIVAREFREFLLREESPAILASFGNEHEMNERAGRIRVPTRLIWGEKDTLIPFEAFGRWRAELGKGLGDGLVAESLPSGTHSLHLESPLAVARAIASACGRDPAR
jgi:pimeloyl-ACP methyl ester carboxylesterase